MKFSGASQATAMSAPYLPGQVVRMLSGSASYFLTTQKTKMVAEIMGHHASSSARPHNFVNKSYSNTTAVSGLYSRPREKSYKYHTNSRCDKHEYTRYILVYVLDTTYRTVVGRGEKSLLCDPGSELRLLIGGRKKEGRR